MHRHAALAERQGHSAGADPQLQGCTVAGEAGEEVDGRAEDRRVEHRRRPGVVGGGDWFVEAVLGHASTVARRQLAQRARICRGNGHDDFTAAIRPFLTDLRPQNRRRGRHPLASESGVGLGSYDSAKSTSW